MTGSSQIGAELRHIWRKVSGQRARAQRIAKQEFWAAVSALGPDDIVIDLGANAGEFTVPLAKTGAQVHAFEPDGHALSNLHGAIQGLPNVTLHEAAAGTQAGTAKLFRAEGFDRNPDRKSKSSSLLQEKRNVAEAGALEVQIIDFPAFLRGLDSDIALIKMDIEGAEVDLLEAILNLPEADRIGKIFVETHERALPHLTPRYSALKSAYAARTAPYINWDWH